MTNITKFQFFIFDITDKNYLYRILDVKIYLDAMYLRNIIKKNNNASN